jgi:hypothetical protein
MTTFTMCYSRGHFIVTGPDIEPRKFKSRREAKDWCAEHHPGSPSRKSARTPKDGRRELRHGRRNDMNYRTHFVHRIDTWDDDGENVIEHLASVEDFEVAMATYRAACQRWPGAALVILISNA